MMRASQPMPMVGRPTTPLMRAILCLTFLLVACDAEEPPPPDPDPQPVPAQIAYPLSVSANGRFLADRLGRPIYLQGDAAWSLIANVSLEDAEVYLTDRAAKGVNAINVNLIETAFSDQDPPWKNVNGEVPFSPLPDTYILDFSKPNEAYWAHVDAVLAAAAEKDILVFAFPAYMGWMQQFDGWSYALDANGVARMRAYGEFLGKRYANQPNLIWVAGGDWGPSGPTYELADEVAAWVAGIRAHDTTHLWTAHGGQQSGTEAYGYLNLDLNTTYRYPPTQVPEAVQVDVRRTPRIPVVFFEGWYENEYSTTTAQLRYQAYTSILGGAMGQFYGNNPIWEFGDGWKQALNDPGAQDMVHVAELFRSRPFHQLVPDDAGSVVTGPRGSLLDGTYVAAARAESGVTSVVYVPDNRSVAVNLGRAVDADNARIWCVDPKTGIATDRGTVPAQGQYTASPCASPDWILVVDDADLGLGAPGR